MTKQCVISRKEDGSVENVVNMFLENQSYFTKDNINNKAEKLINEDNATTFKRFTSEEHAGLRTGGKYLAAAGYIANTVFESSGITEESEIEVDKRIEEYAKAEGIWQEYDSLGQFDVRGSESFVWFKGDKVLKAVNYLETGTINDFIDNIVIHNRLFPATNINVVGFTKQNDFLRFLVEQPTIIGEPATPDQIKTFMDSLGFAQVGIYTGVESSFQNNNYLADDFGSHNVLVVGEEKAIIPFDNFLYLNNNNKRGGTRTRSLGITELDINFSENTIKDLLTPGGTSMGRLLSFNESEKLQKEIEDNYSKSGSLQFGIANNDIRQNLYNYDNPMYQKDISGLDIRITEGLIRVDENSVRYKTYLVYANGQIVGEFKNSRYALKIMIFLEANFVKGLDTNLKMLEVTQDDVDKLPACI